MDWGFAIAAWLYFVGSTLMFVQTAYDDDPWWVRMLAVLGWPIIFPYAMIFGR